MSPNSCEFSYVPEEFAFRSRPVDGTYWDRR